MKLHTIPTNGHFMHHKKTDIFSNRKGTKGQSHLSKGVFISPNTSPTIQTQLTHMQSFNQIVHSDDKKWEELDKKKKKKRNTKPLVDRKLRRHIKIS